MHEFRNVSELKSFAQANSLLNGSNARLFRGLVSMKTKNNEFTEVDSEILISFHDYANIQINDCPKYLHHHDYPIKFDVRYQNFDHQTSDCIVITGNHPNPNIENYVVKIQKIE